VNPVTHLLEKIVQDADTLIRFFGFKQKPGGDAVMQRLIQPMNAQLAGMNSSIQEYISRDFGVDELKKERLTQLSGISEISLACDGLLLSAVQDIKNVVSEWLRLGCHSQSRGELSAFQDFQVAPAFDSSLLPHNLAGPCPGIGQLVGQPLVPAFSNLPLSLCLGAAGESGQQVGSNLSAAATSLLPHGQEADSTLSVLTSYHVSTCAESDGASVLTSQLEVSVDSGHSQTQASPTATLEAALSDGELGVIDQYAKSKELLSRVNRAVLETLFLRMIQDKWKRTLIDFLKNSPRLEPELLVEGFEMADSGTFEFLIRHYKDDESFMNLLSARFFEKKNADRFFQILPFSGNAPRSSKLALERAITLGDRKSIAYLLENHREHLTGSDNLQEAKALLEKNSSQASTAVCPSSFSGRNPPITPSLGDEQQEGDNATGILDKLDRNVEVRALQKKERTIPPAVPYAGSPICISDSDDDTTEILDGLDEDIEVDAPQEKETTFAEQLVRIPGSDKAVGSKSAPAIQGIKPAKVRRVKKAHVIWSKGPTEIRRFFQDEKVKKSMTKFVDVFAMILHRDGDLQLKDPTLLVELIEQAEKDYPGYLVSRPNNRRKFSMEQALKLIGSDDRLVERVIKSGFLSDAKCQAQLEEVVEERKRISSSSSNPKNKADAEIFAASASLISLAEAGRKPPSNKASLTKSAKLSMQKRQADAGSDDDVDSGSSSAPGQDRGRIGGVADRQNKTRLSSLLEKGDEKEILEFFKNGEIPKSNTNFSSTFKYLVDKNKTAESLVVLMESASKEFIDSMRLPVNRNRIPLDRVFRVIAGNSELVKRALASELIRSRPGAVDRLNSFVIRK
jgi:hypothetical protein